MRRIANGHNILSLRVDAKNSIKDAWSSFVAFGSVLVASLGFSRMDAIGGILAGIYLPAESYVALRESSLVLLDGSHEPGLICEIESMIGMNNQIKEMKDSRLRRAGPFIAGMLEVVVDGGITVKQMYEVITELENSIGMRIPGLRSVTMNAIHAS